MLMNFPSRLVLLFGLCVVGFAQPDELTTPGGEVLRGTYLKTEGGIIHFQSDAFGLIKVKATAAKLVQGKAVATKEDPKPASPPTKPEPTAEVAAKAEAAPAAPVGKLREALGLPESVQAQFTLGISSLNAQADNLSISSGLNFSYQDKRDFLIGRISYAKGESGPVVYQDDFNVKLDYLRFLEKNDKWYLYAGAHFEEDPVHFVEYDFDLLFGVGRNFIQTQKTTLRFTAAGNAEWEDLASSVPGVVPDPSQTFETKFGFSNELEVKLTPTLTFKETFSLLVNPEDVDDHDISVMAELAGALTSQLTLSLVYTYDYDGTPAFNVVKSQSQITTQLGYRF